MTPAEECRATRQALGVYVVGAIEPAERAFVDGHLRGCGGCREELAVLAGLPAALRTVPVPEAEQVLQTGLGRPPEGGKPPDERLRQLMERVTRVRRARRWRRRAAVAVVVVMSAAGGALGWQVLPSVGAGGPPPAASAAPWTRGWETVRGHSPQTLTSATVKYAPRPWGTALAVQARGVPPGTVCQLLVTDAAGHHSAAGGWTAVTGAGSAWYPGSTSVAAGDLRRVQITGDGRPLVTIDVR